MATDDGVNIKVGNDLIKPIIEAKITAAILSALDDKDRILSSIVDRILRQKVDEQGRPTNYNGQPVIDQILQTSLHNMVRESFTEWINENNGALKEMVKKELVKRSKSIAENFVSDLATEKINSWRFGINVRLEKLKDD